MAGGGVSRRSLAYIAGGALLATAAPARAASPDPFQALAEDHARILRLLDQIQATDDLATNDRVRLLKELRREVARHAAVEEYVLYPAMRQVADTKNVATDFFADHAEVKTLLYELELTPRSDVRWILKAGDLRRLLETHMRREETDVFPRHKASLNAAQLEFLAQLAQRERQDA